MARLWIFAGGIGLASAMLLVSPACIRPEGKPARNQRPVEDWKQQCGLLWILSLDSQDRPSLQITGKGGELLDYGGGFTFDNRHLASSFCRTDILAVKTFHCIIDLERPAPASATLEAWFQGQLLQSWTLPRVRHFEATVTLPSGSRDRSRE